MFLSSVISLRLLVPCSRKYKHFCVSATRPIPTFGTTVELETFNANSRVLNLLIGKYLFSLRKSSSLALLKNL